MKCFSLQSVKLLDSAFKQKQGLNKKYLLEFPEDRLLHTFRVNAGLESKAKPLGGWEAPDHQIRGNFMGHFLSACAREFSLEKNGRLKEKTVFLINELAHCQQALGGRYLSVRGFKPKSLKQT